jgi:hypothetical protein
MIASTPTPSKPCCQLRQLIVPPVRPAIFDAHVLAFDITQFIQSRAESGCEGRALVG